MTPDQFRAGFREIPLFGPIMDWVEIWFRDWAGTTFHDPLAAATIFEPSLCRWQKGRVQVDLAEGDLFGLTRWIPGAPEAPHEIAVDVDPRRFFDHYRAIVQAKP